MIKGNSWGYQLTVDCGACDFDQMNSSENIANFLKTLLDSIEMKAYGDPQITDFEMDGRSLIQLVEFNNKICLHTCPGAGTVYIDILSSNYFESQDIETVVLKVKEYFNPQFRLVTTQLNRDGQIDMETRTIQQVRWV